MLLALTVLLMQSPAIPAPAVPTTTTNSANVSVTAATETKTETKQDTKSADAKESSAPVTVAQPLFPSVPAGYMPGQTELTSVDGTVLAKVNSSDDSGAYSSSLSNSTSLSAPEPIILAPIKQKRPEAVFVRVPKMWFVLGAMEHGTVTFDAWSTRRNIVEGGMYEADPIMRPFANSSAMYAAVQVAPVLFDFLSKQMMHNSHEWVRRSWWVPQTASTVASMLSGVHNVAIH
jgi:hypothetical protein